VWCVFVVCVCMCVGDMCIMALDPAVAQRQSANVVELHAYDGHAHTPSYVQTAKDGTAREGFRSSCSTFQGHLYVGLARTTCTVLLAGSP